MVYTRGNRADFDHWAALGNPGWSYDEVLPAFPPIGEFRGRRFGVPWRRRRAERRGAAVAQPADAGVPRRRGAVAAPGEPGFQRCRQEGFGTFQVTQKNGERWSSARAYLHPILRRPNLVVLENTLTRRIDFDGTRAIGVTVRRDGQETTIRAARDVVLAACAVASPQLLLLSGVGEAAMLAGQWYPSRPRPAGRRPQSSGSPGRGCHRWRPYVRLLRPFLGRPALDGGGRRSSISSPAVARSPTTTVEAGGFVRSSPDLDRPEPGADLRAAAQEPVRPAGCRSAHGHTIHVSLVRPKSRGQVSLASADPTRSRCWSRISLAHEDDLKSLVSGVKLARRILAAPALRPLPQGGAAAWRDVATDEELVAFIRRSLATTYHRPEAAGWGTTPDAVVDAQAARPGAGAAAGG